jgi:hypothetical protein
MGITIVKIVEIACDHGSRGYHQRRCELLEGPVSVCVLLGAEDSASLGRRIMSGPAWLA